MAIAVVDQFHGSKTERPLSAARHGHALSPIQHGAAVSIAIRFVGTRGTGTVVRVVHAFSPHRGKAAFHRGHRLKNCIYLEPN